MATKRIWKPLTEEQKNDLIELVMYAHNLANKNPSMRRLAVYLIKVAGWRWTADAVDSATGIVIPDAIKYDIRYLPHTSDAAMIYAQYPKELGKRLRHEHTVPLGVIADWVMNLKTNDKEAIYNIFSNHCWAAIVTREEDQKLNSAKLQSVMPSEWEFGNEITARYKKVGIELLQPQAI
jgi:hypothetical protein